MNQDSLPQDPDYFSLPLWLFIPGVILLVATVSIQLYCLYLYWKYGTTVERPE